MRYLQPLDGTVSMGLLHDLPKIPHAGQGRMNSDFVCNWHIMGDESQDEVWIHLPKGSLHIGIGKSYDRVS